MVLFAWIYLRFLLEHTILRRRFVGTDCWIFHEARRVQIAVFSCFFFSFLFIGHTDTCCAHRSVCRTAPVASTLDNVAGIAPSTNRSSGWLCRAPACPAYPAFLVDLGRTIRIGRERREIAWPAEIAAAPTTGATCHETSMEYKETHIQKLTISK